MWCANDFYRDENFHLKAYRLPAEVVQALNLVWIQGPSGHPALTSGTSGHFGCLQLAEEQVERICCLEPSWSYCSWTARRDLLESFYRQLIGFVRCGLLVAVSPKRGINRCSCAKTSGLSECWTQRLTSRKWIRPQPATSALSCKLSEERVQSLRQSRRSWKPSTLAENINYREW